MLASGVAGAAKMGNRELLEENAEKDDNWLVFSLAVFISAYVAASLLSF